MGKVPLKGGSYFREEGHREGECDLPASAVFSDAKLPYFGVARPDSHHYPFLNLSLLVKVKSVCGGLWAEASACPQ